MKSKRRYFYRQDNDDELGEILGVILFLLIGYLIYLFSTNKSKFWIVAIISVISIVGLILILRKIFYYRERKREERINKLWSQIKENDLTGYINNFIHMFGHEKKKKGWRFRDYCFDWDRLKDLRKFLNEKGVKVSLNKWDDMLEILRRFIQSKEERFTKESITGQIQGKFSDLSPEEFEYLICRLYEAMGYSVEHVGGLEDRGGDVIAVRGNERILIQAKRWLREEVNIDAVRQVFSALKPYNCNKAVVIATNDFTFPATDLAKFDNAELINKKQLQELLLKYLNESWS
jgi:HJR/Mrr/RecB family endonuclease